MLLTPRTPLLILLAALAWSASAADPYPRPTVGPTNSYTVTFTGRLFGYFRIPEVQPFDMHSCPAGLPNDTTPEALAFQKLSGSVEAPGTKVLVAVGDNFAPFLLSRKLLRSTGDPLEDNFRLVDKSHYEYSPASQTWVHEIDLATDPQYDVYLKGQGSVPMDNVACFLLSQHFDAIVPGPHDFYFGPERLRELAKLLNSRSENTTRMLASNLYIARHYIGPGASGGAAAGNPNPGRKAAPKSDPSSAKPRIVLPQTVLPWMRAVLVKNAFPVRSLITTLTPPHPEVAVQPSALPPATAPPPSVAAVCAFKATNPPLPLDPPQNCASAPLHFSPRGHDGVDAEFWLDRAQAVLDPGPYRIYAVDTNGKSVAEDFDVQLPYLEFPAMDGELAGRFKPWAYKKADRDGAQSVAVFGVVGSGLLDQVGSLNSMWLYSSNGRDDDRRELDVEASDAADALRQVFQYCEEDPDCHAARKVLLAQMPQAEAYTLAPRIVVPAGALPVDIVVAEADPDRASGDRELTRVLPNPPARPPAGSAEPAGAQVIEPPPPIRQPALTPIAVLVPGSHFASDSPYALRVQVSSATVVPSFPSADGDLQYLINHISRSNDAIPVNPFPAELDYLRTGPTKKLSEWAAPDPKNDNASYLQFATDAGLPPPAPPSAILAAPPAGAANFRLLLQNIALYAMRETCHADASMIQDRDIFLVLKDFSSMGVNEEGLWQLASVIFWKDDFLICQNLSGDTINSALKTSQQLKTSQDLSLTSDLDENWNIITLGADPLAPSDTTRLIDAQLVDPKRLYSVALTDYLASGATGYSMLKNAEPPPVTPWSKVHLRPLSYVVAAMIYNHRPPDHTAFYRGRDLLDEMALKDAVAAAQHAGIPLGSPLAAFVTPPKPKQPGFRDWVRAFVSPDGLTHVCASGIHCLEESAQEKPILWLNLYKADLSYSLFLHNGSEASIAQRFPGITSVPLTTPESATKAADYIVRFERDSRHFIEYVQSSLNFGYKVQRGTGGPSEAYQPNQTADYWYQEAGVGYRFGPMRSSPSGWKFILAGGVQTQPSRPLTQFSPSAYGISGSGAKGASSAPPVAAPRSIYDLQHAGLRYDFTYPKPKNPNQSGGGGQGAASAAAPAGGGGGKKGGGGGASQTASSGQSGQGGGGGGGAQSQTYNTYLEFGVERGTNYHGIDKFLFPTGNSCSIADLNCIDLYGAQGTLSNVITGRVHQTRGFYFNFRFDAPLPVLAYSELVLENRGSWYLPHQDLYVDTRLNNDFKVSLNVPVWQKMSLAPSLEFFLYENQVNAHIYRSYSSSLSLNYTFEWHPGLKLSKVVGYQNPVPALPTLPSK